MGMNVGKKVEKTGLLISSILEIEEGRGYLSTRLWQRIAKGPLKGMETRVALLYYPGGVEIGVTSKLGTSGREVGVCFNPVQSLVELTNNLCKLYFS